MQNLWNLAPWMRRRAQRHMERGGSAKVMHYILNTSGSDPAETVDLPAATSATNVHNIILFRALRGSVSEGGPPRQGN